MGKLNIVGLGYIGLPTGLMFAANGIEVVGTDLNKELVKTLQNKKLTFEENGLQELFEKAGAVFKLGIGASDSVVNENRQIYYYRSYAIYQGE